MPLQSKGIKYSSEAGGQRPLCPLGKWRSTLKTYPDPEDIPRHGYNMFRKQTIFSMPRNTCLNAHVKHPPTCPHVSSHRYGYRAKYVCIPQCEAVCLQCTCLQNFSTYTHVKSYTHAHTVCPLHTHAVIRGFLWSLTPHAQTHPHIYSPPQWN